MPHQFVILIDRVWWLLIVNGFDASRLQFARCPSAERSPMIRFGTAPASTITIDDQRIVPNAHTRDVIYGVVLNEFPVSGRIQTNHF